jgi:hypothetical protein
MMEEKEDCNSRRREKVCSGSGTTVEEPSKATAHPDKSKSAAN